MREPFNVVAPMASADGYGYSAERLVTAAVREHHARIGFVRHDWTDDRYTDPDLLALEIPAHAVALRDLVVVYFLPFAFGRSEFRARVTLGMTMFETDRLPDLWAHCCEQTHGLIVPSEHCRRVFRERVSKPVEVAPLGVDTDLYRPATREPGRRPFTFLMAGLLHYRKGVEFAVRAFRDEFEAGEPVALVLKTRRGFLDPAPGWKGYDDPRITVVDDDYSREDMRALYAEADCFLAPSRGEASGLTPREAMATGLPAIVTDWGGLREIADPRYTYPVRVEELEPAPADCTSYGAGVTGGGPIGNFARPSLRDLRGAMRHVYEHPELAQRKGLRAAGWMRERFDWRVCARQWLDAVGRLYEPYRQAAA